MSAPWTGAPADGFPGTQVRHQGHIRAGGVDKDVTFVAVDDGELNERIDAAYRAKYRRYGPNIIGDVVTQERKPRRSNSRRAEKL